MPAGRPKIHHTEEARKEALLISYARYRQKHQAEIRERNKKWEDTNKEQRKTKRRQRYREILACQELVQKKKPYCVKIKPHRSLPP